MSTPLHIAILAGTETAPEQLFRSAFGDRSPTEALRAAAGQEISVSLICRGEFNDQLGISMIRRLRPNKTPLIDKAIAALRLEVLDKAFRRSSVGRLLISLGPTDSSRVVWRAVNADHEAMSVLRSADIVVAADLAAVRTAWHLVQGGAVPHSYFGLQAAEKILLARTRKQ